MTPGEPHVIIFADAPEALVKLCGISLLERQLRILRRLEVREAMVVSSAPDGIHRAIEPPSWSRQGLTTRIISPNELKPGISGRVLLLPGGLYLDARLIRALLEARGNAILVDSDPPEFARPLLVDCRGETSRFDSGAAFLLPNEFERWQSGLLPAEFEAIDAARVPSYVRGMRRHVRPVFFPAASPALRHLAEKIIFDSTQNGTLDFPALIHAPLENLILRRLCRTTITPNQITGFGFAVAAIAAVFFARGHLGWGMIPALAFGVIDGLDGKQARVKIETTPGGKWEHYLDFVIETGWWAALAFWFQQSGQLPGAWLFFAVITGAEILDQLAKWSAQQRIACLLDDCSPFDRFVRLIGARRNIYLFSLAAGLSLGVAAPTYRLCAVWGALTALVHVARAIMLRWK